MLSTILFINDGARASVSVLSWFEQSKLLVQLIMLLDVDPKSDS